MKNMAPIRARAENITLVLHRPKHHGNIGSAARCAKNMGMRNIVVVSRDEPDMEKIRQMSTHLAVDVVERIRFVESLDEALGGFQWVVGTTSRTGSMRQPSGSPREVAANLVNLSQKNKVAVLFGPEDIGLTNDELKHCQALITIPTSDKLRSLNLSHAVMIVCYEIFLASTAVPERFKPRLAPSAELEGMYGQIQDLFVRIGFINPQNPDYWMLNVRRFFSRIDLRSRDVKMIRGLCRRIDWCVRDKKA
jgi:tRNA/rRNA methyltransferase